MAKTNVPEFLDERGDCTEFAEKLSEALSETQIKVNIGTIEI
ncbi:hypothetical protein MHD_04530 [Mannheimia granulomatis]|uniref:Uncharacterized protein n=1 Tax=Mannheimia granulomatis TaxID=85402 RepID=A0A011LWN1_9PAST|nr:hypothetical protein [Mannheimia granulomatis]EXI61608.1 hypothetical protein AK33_09690 [Mannheimia granulomatis]RGE48388.1 hypothetical protein MHD_04530 [Mannheimia granulomatis]